MIALSVVILVLSDRAWNINVLTVTLIRYILLLSSIIPISMRVNLVNLIKNLFQGLC